MITYEKRFSPVQTRSRIEWLTHTEVRFSSLSVCTLLLLAILMTSCATPPPPSEKVYTYIAPHITMERFQTDQQTRQKQLQRWHVSGVLELTTDRGSRRYRTDISGVLAEEARVTLFGLMQQVAALLFAGPQEIRLVDPDKQHILEVPASAEGLYHLLGIGLQPEVLFESMLALAAPLAEPDPDLPNGWWTRQGERLVLEPSSGLIQERFGLTEGGSSYRVAYEWSPSPSTPLLPMPTQIHVMLLPGETEVKYRVRQWHSVEQPFATDWFAALQIYAGFSVERPFQEASGEP